MKSEPIAEKVSFGEFVYGNYLGRHNLAVIKTKWIDGKLHVWTEYKQNEEGD